MTATFFGSNWCDLSWTPFVPFLPTTAERRIFPKKGGVYRVRVTGRDVLAYIGETGLKLRDRLAPLMVGTLAEEMPFGDPHTAAPKLWSFRQADGIQYEASVAACDLPKADRKALECFLVWQYRVAAGQSPLCNFGRLHPQYITSKNRSTGLRGCRIGDKALVTSKGPSIGALALKSRPTSLDWMGLAWTEWVPLATARRSGASRGPAVYRIRDEDGCLMYIGQSFSLTSRLRKHARRLGPGAMLCSITTVSADYTTTQLCEIENDLIAGYYSETRHAPTRQFGQSGEGLPPAER